jgi:restriction endonuclease S subunit
MYGQGITRGRTAKLGIDAATNQACAVLFNINEEIILTDFLWIYLINEYERLRELASGNNQPNLNAGMIQDYKIQIPPKKIQREIIQQYNSNRKKIKALEAKSEENLSMALQEFEQSIFNNK